MMVRTIEGSAGAAGFRFVLVVSKYHDFVTDRLQAAALGVLSAAGVDSNDVAVVRVPGAFEIPVTAQPCSRERSLRRGHLSRLSDSRAETPHFDYIAAVVSHGLAAAASATGVPMAFGVLTTNTVDEALARAGEGSGNKGREAATAAVEMVSVMAQLGPRSGES